MAVRRNRSNNRRIWCHLPNVPVAADGWRGAGAQSLPEAGISTSTTATIRTLCEANSSMLSISSHRTT